MKKNTIYLLIFSLFLIFFSCEDEVDKEVKSGKVQLESAIWPPDLGEIPVELEENPLTRNYYMIFDGSGSMKGDKLDVAKKALFTFIDIIPEDANTGLLVFDSKGIFEKVSFGKNREILKDAVMAVTAGSGTPLYSSIKMAYDSLVLQGHKQQGYGEYHLVIVTDGEASKGEDPRYIVDDVVGNSPVIIHTIGFKIGRDHSLNQPDKILYKSAENYKELSKGLEDVLAESEDFLVTDF